MTRLLETLTCFELHPQTPQRMSLQTHRILWFRGFRLDGRYSTECIGLPKDHLKPNLKTEPEKGRKLDPSASLNAGFHQVHRACFAGSTHCLSTRMSRSA